METHLHVFLPNNRERVRLSGCGVEKLISGIHTNLTENIVDRKREQAFLCYRGILTSLANERYRSQRLDISIVRYSERPKGETVS